MIVPVEQAAPAELVQLVLDGAEANERPDIARRIRAAGSDVASVLQALDSLEVDLRARRAALCDPGRPARLAAESRHAAARLRRFQQQAARWPRTLGDAVAAASSDVEYAAQTRLRALLDEATARIESGGRGGEDLESWLHERLSAEVRAGQQALRERAAEIATRVAADLQLPGPMPPVTLDLEPPEQMVSRLHRGHPARTDRQPLATRLLGVIMPTYSGMMVALVLPRLFGLRLPLWVIVTVAVAGAAAMGGAALAGERQRQLSRRNAETAGDVRSRVDTLRMALSKQNRDGVRAIEQQLQSALDEAVGERTRRMAAAADSLREAADDADHTRQAIRDIDDDLASIHELRLRAGRLARLGRLARP